ncbi:MAG: divalent-cation tolerance protein CutA, partial [Betaproteobacteria bacterium]|nr:divalent-cation tolerance protein CutA [Betaproteobacteria bacterium]
MKKADDSTRLVLTNLPDRAAAERLADEVIASRLAACVNILAPCRSVYRWKGEVQH